MIQTIERSTRLGIDATGQLRWHASDGTGLPVTGRRNHVWILTLTAASPFAMPTSQPQYQAPTFEEPQTEYEADCLYENGLKTGLSLLLIAAVIGLTIAVVWAFRQKIYLAGLGLLLTLSGCATSYNSLTAKSETHFERATPVAFTDSSCAE